MIEQMLGPGSGLVRSACAAALGLVGVLVFATPGARAATPVFDPYPDINLVTQGSSLVVNYPLPTASDPATSPPTPATVTCNPAAGFAFPAGTTPVDCTADDGSGNTQPLTFNVTI